MSIPSDETMKELGLDVTTKLSFTVISPDQTVLQACGYQVSGDSRRQICLTCTIDRYILGAWEENVE